MACNSSLGESGQRWRMAIVTAVLVETSIKTLGDTTFCVNTLLTKSYKPPPPRKAPGVAPIPLRLQRLLCQPQRPGCLPPLHRLPRPLLTGTTQGALLLPSPTTRHPLVPCGHQHVPLSQFLWRVIPCFGSKPSLVTQPLPTPTRPWQAGSSACQPTTPSTRRPPDRARCPAPAPDGLAHLLRRASCPPLPTAYCAEGIEKDTHFLSS